MAHPILPPGSTRSSSSFLFALLCGRSSSPPMAREHSLVATCRSWRVAIRLEGRRGSLQKSLTRQSCERFLQRSSPSLKWVWSDMIKYPFHEEPDGQRARRRYQRKDTQWKVVE